MSAFWTDERIAELIRLWRNGNSVAHIARVIGHPSRSAIIGKVHRLGLQRVRKSRPEHSRSPEVTMPKPKPKPALPRPPAATPIRDGIGVMDLTHDMCRWPYGDVRAEGVTFCGRPALEGRSYCREHFLLSIRRAAE